MSFKEVYNGNLTNNQTISAVTNYNVMVGFTTITHNVSSDYYPYVSIDGLSLGGCRGVGTRYTEYRIFILFNFNNMSGTFAQSSGVSGCAAQTENKALIGKIRLEYVQSAKLSLYAI